MGKLIIFMRATSVTIILRKISNVFFLCHRILEDTGGMLLEITNHK